MTDLFSTDSMIDMLARLGVHVRFVMKSSRRRMNPERDRRGWLYRDRMATSNG